jgi:heptosyltransferase I
MNKDPIKTICIVRLSALGDVLMLVPLIRTLQKKLPDVKLTWIISNPAYELVKSITGVEFIVIDKPNTVIDYLRFKKMMSKRHFDVLFATQSSLRANLLYGFIKAKRKIGYDNLRAKDFHKLFINEQVKPGRDHTLDGFLRFAEALDIKDYDIRWDLKINELDYAWAQKSIGKNGPDIIVLINPAASKPERSWSVDGYVAIINYVQSKYNAKVFLIGGPNRHDKELGDLIASKVSVINLIGKTKLTQLLAVISLGDILICPDTGPSHMGSAVGTKVMALHAVTSVNVSGPYLSRHRCVCCYDKAVKDILNKNLKDLPWGTHVHGEKTMQLIKPDMVFKKLDEELSSKAVCVK